MPRAALVPTPGSSVQDLPLFLVFHNRPELSSRNPLFASAKSTLRTPRRLTLRLPFLTYLPGLRTVFQVLPLSVDLMTSCGPHATIALPPRSTPSSTVCDTSPRTAVNEPPLSVERRTPVGPITMTTVADGA